jgi:pyruvate,water dikinase
VKRWVYAFTETLPPGLESRALLGGKGAGLAELTRAGFTVPPGFTIITEACRWFYDHRETWPPELEAQIREQMAGLEAATGRTFGAGPDRLLVSVRSGAAVSMPGMMDTVLNVGAGEEAWTELARCINAVFRSWMNERAVAYRTRHRLSGLPGTAVNVQAMFPSQVSGVLFTENPNLPSARQIIVEASHGLGEALVSGAVTPDRFLLARDGLKVTESALRDRSTLRSSTGPGAPPAKLPATEDGPTLSAAQLVELCALALRVEQHFGQPQDIEWAWADGQFALLQCRPIRGLELVREAERVRAGEITRLQALAGSRRRLWVAHNLGETLPHPTPLTWDIIRQFMSGDGGFGRLYRDLGYCPAPEVCAHGFLELIAGRIYADPDRAARLFWAGWPMSYDLEALRRDPNAINLAPTKFDLELMDGWFLLRLPRLAGAMWRSARAVKRARLEARNHFERNVLPPYLGYVRTERARDLRGLSAPELLVELGSRRRRVLDEFGAESLKPGFLGALALSELDQRLRQALGPEEGARLAAALTTALEGDTALEQDSMLAGVALGRVPLAEFLTRFGHRCTGEMELMTPRWREAPAFLESVLHQLRADKGRSAEERRRENEERFRAAQAQLPNTLARAGAGALQEDIAADLRVARELLPYRESAKHYLMMGYELIRQVLLALAGRWDMGDDIFFLGLRELGQFEQRGAELRAEAPRRKLGWEAAKRVPLPALIDSAELASLGLPPKTLTAGRGRELHGEPVSAGLGEGRARIVFDPLEAGDLGPDYILVCPSTDPGWTPLFLRARGLIVERGGVLSHGAIVARDFGIPAVVCPDATRLLPNGARIRVDGNTGVIAWLNEADRL